MKEKKVLDLKPVHTMTEEQKEEFYKFQMEAIRKDLKKSQHWKDMALQRVGDIVVW